MAKVKKEGVILEPTNLEFENQAVLNPAAIKVGNKVHIFYRAVRKGNYSSIGHAILDGPLKVIKRYKKPILKPETAHEKHGIEDPRIVKINNKYIMTYMCYDGNNVTADYAVSNDLKTFKKRKTIFPLFSYAKAMKLLGRSKQKE